TTRNADPDPLRSRLRAAAAQKNLSALRDIAQSVDVSALSVPSSHLLSAALWESGDRAVAIRFLRRTQRQHPGDYVVNLALAGYLHVMDPRPADEVIRYCAAALAVRPRSPVAHHNLGVALARKGLLDDAVAEYREAIRQKPDFAPAYDGLGNALSKQGLLDEAIAAQQTAIRLNPHRAAAHYNLGNHLARQGQFDAAIAHYRKAIRLEPDFAYAHCN